MLFLFLILINIQQVQAEEPFRYEPGKLVELRAKQYCQTLAGMSLGRQAIVSISVHTKPTIVGTSHKGKKAIAVYYPYRTDGVMFACVFYDYTDGQLQLIEFGHVGKETDDVTKINLLY